MATFKVKANGDMVANRFLSSKPLYDETTANLAVFGMTGWDFTLTGAFYEGLSLQDIFETNNLVLPLSSWSYPQPPGAYESAEEISFVGTYALAPAQDAVTLTTAEKYYFAFRIYNVLKFAVTNILDTEDYVAVAEYVDGTIRLRKAQSVEFTPTLTDGVRLELVGSKSGSISYARLLNTDTLFTTAPSKAQLDMWYNIYVFLKTKGTATTGALDNDYYIDITNKVLVEPTDTFTTAQEIADFKIKMADSLNVTHFQVQKYPGFTNIYGTAFLVWQTLTLAAIFGEGYVVDPSDTLQVPTVWTNQYYDTETKAITVGELGGNLTFTNNSESPITVYVVNITSTFNIKPNVTRMNNMEKMFFMSGTTNEILDLQFNKFYVDYDNNIIYNLTTIFGSGSEPSLLTFTEMLKPTLKAKAFENTLQQEYMRVKLTTPIDLLDGYTLDDVFTNSQAVSTPQATLDELEKAYEILMGTSTGTGVEMTLDRIYLDYDNAKVYDFELVREYAPSLDEVIYEGLSLRDIFENDTDGITLPNGVKTFEISGNDLVQKVKKYTIQSSDISNILNSTIVQQITINTINLIGKNEWTNNVLGDVKINNYIERRYGVDSGFAIDDVWSIGKFSTTNTQLIVVYFALDTYTSLAEAQSDLAGTVIYYQLATPIVLQTFTTAPTQTQLDTWLATYLARQPQALVESILAKTITLTSIPVKARITKDVLYILGSYVTVGE